MDPDEEARPGKTGQVRGALGAGDPLDGRAGLGEVAEVDRIGSAQLGQGEGNRRRRAATSPVARRPTGPASWAGPRQGPSPAPRRPAAGARSPPRSSGRAASRTRPPRPAASRRRRAAWPRRSSASGQPSWVRAADHATAGTSCWAAWRAAATISDQRSGAMSMRPRSLRLPASSAPSKPRWTMVVEIVPVVPDGLASSHATRAPISRSGVGPVASSGIEFGTPIAVGSQLSSGSRTESCPSARARTSSRPSPSTSTRSGEPTQDGASGPAAAGPAIRAPSSRRRARSAALPGVSGPAGQFG